MKRFLALGLGCMLAQGAMAQDNTTPLPPVTTTPVPPVILPPIVGKTLPLLPSDCSEQVGNNGLYCSSQAIAGNKVSVTFAAVVNKDIADKCKSKFSPAFNDVEDLLSYYLDFSKWPTYAAISTQKVIEFTKTVGSKDLGVGDVSTADAEGNIPTRHGYSYSLKVKGLELIKQSVTGVTYNYRVTPYEGALGSLEFVAIKNPPKDLGITTAGVNSQTGSIHAVACSTDLLESCTDDKILLIYETTIEPNISFAIKIAAATVTSGIEDLLMGMLTQQELPLPDTCPAN
ncbi:MAG: hypothetical protein H7318_14035 [Oligoflexus sp.]|nr:hypothetical protein [Oligoflexus sp.]